MNSYWARLNSTERRFLVGVGLVLFIVVNLFWIWPHFSDWGNLKMRLGIAQRKLRTYRTTIAQDEKLKPTVHKMEGEGPGVPPEDQAIQFLRTIQAQAGQCGVGFIGNSRPTTQTNDFFLEQVQTVTVQATEKQLVNFLYNLGSGNSLIRVRALSLRPDPSHTRLNAYITLVASYQKGAHSQHTASVAPARVDPHSPLLATRADFKPAPPTN